MQARDEAEASVRPRYRIVEDEPGRRLTLAWSGSSPAPLVRAVGLLLVAVVLAAVCWFAIDQALPQWKAGLKQPDADALAMSVLSGFVLLGGVALVVAILRIGTHATRYVREICFDAAEQMVSVTHGGWMLVGVRHTRVPLSAVQRCIVTIGPENARGGMSVRFSLNYRAADQPFELAFAAPIEKVFRRSEALELFFRLARIFDCPRFALVRNDASVLQVSLLIKQQPLDDDLDDDDEEDELEDDDAAESAEPSSAHAPQALSGPCVLDVPHDLRVADARVFDQPRGFVAPDMPVPAFVLDAIDDECAPARVVEWHPPEWVHTARDSVPRGVIVAGGGLGALAGGGLGAWLLHNVADMFLRLPPSRWETAAFGSLLGGIAGAFLIWAFNRRRDVTIDAERGQIICRQGDLARSYSTHEVCEVRLIGEKLDQTEADGKSTYPGYSCRIELGVGELGEWVFEYGDYTRDRTTPYRKLLPLSIELARMLDVPWRWHDYADRAKANWFPRLGWKERSAVAALVLSLVGYVALAALGERDSLQAVEEIRASGGEISFLDGYSIQNYPVLRNYWRVTFPPGPVDQDRLRSLAPTLGKIERLGLEFADTRIDDSGVALLSPLSNLLLLDLNSTWVTGRALETINGLQALEALNLNNTAVDNEGLKRLAPLPKLRVLMLGHTRITDEGLAELAKLPALEYVALYRLQLSPAAIAKLRAAKPKLIIAM